jgi:hypothetical protein
MSVLANALLLAITGPGAPDRNGDATTGEDLWTGRAGGYLKRARRSTVSGGQQLLVKTDTLTILDQAVAAAITASGATWEASTVLIEDRRSAVSVLRRFTVTAAEHRAAGTICDSVRLELAAETAAA